MEGQRTNTRYYLIFAILFILLFIVINGCSGKIFPDPPNYSFSPYKKIGTWLCEEKEIEIISYREKTETFRGIRIKGNVSINSKNHTFRCIGSGDNDNIGFIFDNEDTIYGMINDEDPYWFKCEWGKDVFYATANTDTPFCNQGEKLTFFLEENTE